MSAEIKYKGETVETLNGGEYITLHTKDKIMDDDIRVEVAEESGGGDIAINGIVEQYKVNAGATVNAGDFVEFVNKYGGGTFFDGTINDVSACKLDNSRVLVVYARTNDSIAYAVILSIDNNKIAVGETHSVASASQVSVSALSNNKAIMSYCSNYTLASGTSVRQIYAMVLVIDGTTIKGYYKTIDDGTNPHITALTEYKAVIAYLNNGNVVARVLDISGTELGYGARYTVLTDNSSSISISQICLEKLSENTVIVGGHYSTQNMLYVLSISGKTINIGNVFYPQAINDYFDVVALSADRALLLNVKSTSGNVLELNIDGLTVTGGRYCTIDASNAGYVTACALSESKVLAVYRDPQNSNVGKAVAVTIGDNIVAGTPIVFDYGDVTNSSVVALSPTSALVAYANGAGAYATLSIDGDTITADSAEIGTYVQPATSRLHNVGVAKTSGTEGETVDVYCV